MTRSGDRAEGSEARKARLAEALRANLHRRKAQARARRAADAAVPPETGPDADTSAGED